MTRKTTIGEERTRAEVLATFRDDIELHGWLFWNLHRERLACIDRGENDTLWFVLVCKAITALQMQDYGELARAIERMEGCL